jgi:hypothetical protein
MQQHPDDDQHDTNERPDGGPASGKEHLTSRFGLPGGLVQASQACADAVAGVFGARGDCAARSGLHLGLEGAGLCRPEGGEGLAPEPIATPATSR